MANIGEFLFGRKDKPKQFQQYTPQQMQGLQQMWQSLSGGGGAFGDVFGEFNPEYTANVFERGVAEPAMRNFQQRVQPGIMQAFADQGPNSGLYNSLASAGQDMQQNLNAQLEMYMNQARMQNMQNRMGGLNSFLGAQPYQTYVQQGSPGLIPGMLQGFSQGAGQGLGMYGMGMFGGFGGGGRGGAG